MPGRITLVRFPIIAKTVECVAARNAKEEKHVPQISIDGDKVTVKVGSVEHPSLPEHYIEFILLETKSGIQTRWLKPGDKPEAVFTVSESVLAAYEYCNLHGLWKAEA